MFRDLFQDRIHFAEAVDAGSCERLGDSAQFQGVSNPMILRKAHGAVNKIAQTVDAQKLASVIGRIGFEVAPTLRCVAEMVESSLTLHQLDLKHDIVLDFDGLGVQRVASRKEGQKTAGRIFSLACAMKWRVD